MTWPLVVAIAVTVYCAVLLWWCYAIRRHLRADIYALEQEIVNEKLSAKFIMTAVHQEYLEGAHDTYSLIVGSNKLKKQAAETDILATREALLRWSAILLQLAIAYKRLETAQYLLYANAPVKATSQPIPFLEG